jgi:hypothetical protein
MDLTNCSLIDLSSGTMLTAHNCVIVECSAFSESEWEDLDNASDSKIREIGRERGTMLSEHINALDRIAELMSGSDWSPDTLNEIAEIVRGTGRTIDDM